MLTTYHRSSATLNLTRAFTQGGFADLRRVHEWNRGFTANPAYARYEQLAGEIDRAIRFMAAAGADFDALRTVEFFSSHEALLLDYERPLTRIDSRTGTAVRLLGALPVDRRAHAPARRRARGLPVPGAQPDRGQARPDGRTADDALALMDRLNPTDQPGRLTFITRMGTQRVRDALPPLVEKVAASGRPVTWVCDPMHGNTITSSSGYKTRAWRTCWTRCAGFFEVHRAIGSVPGGHPRRAHRATTSPR